MVFNLIQPLLVLGPLLFCKTARIVSGTKKYEHIVPVLISLHWLPVKARIEYKILLITYKMIMIVVRYTSKIWYVFKFFL